MVKANSITSQCDLNIWCGYRHLHTIYTSLWHKDTYDHMWDSSILHSHVWVHTFIAKWTHENLPKKILLNNIVLTTIELLNTKPPNLPCSVAVKFIIFARHLQRPPPPLYYVSLYMFAYAHASVCL